MKFHVTGENVATSARMTMEIDADSKAAAERKAAAAGMKVHHAAPITADESDRDRRSRRRVTGLHPLLKLVVLLAVLAAAGYFAWPRLRPWLGV